MRLQVIDLRTGEIVRDFDITDWGTTRIEALERGLLSQMDLDNYSVQRVRA